PGDLGLQLGVTLRPRRRGPLLGNPIGVRGDPTAVLTQHPADRLGPETLLMSADECHYFFDWRSSSAPKKADADFKISLARRNSLFSRSRRFIRSRLSLLSPGGLSVGLSTTNPQA